MTKILFLKNIKCIHLVFSRKRIFEKYMLPPHSKGHMMYTHKPLCSDYRTVIYF